MTRVNDDPVGGASIAASDAAAAESPPAPVEPAAEPLPAVARAQIPEHGELNLDHVAHFVPDPEAARKALERLGFTVTPFSEQQHRTEAGGPLVPAGTGNRCVMFRRGYVEFLSPVADTPLAAQLNAAIARYVGVHLVAFGSRNPDGDHARLAAQQFNPLHPVALQRQIGTPEGEDTARFTVVRVPPGTMPEGRIQFCCHHTPQLVWQNRWLTHRNRAVGLRSVILCVEDPDATVERYRRFTGLPAEREPRGWRLTTARGSVWIWAPEATEQALNVRPPALPWIAGYVLLSADLKETRRVLHDAKLAAQSFDERALAVSAPPELGGVVIFSDAA
jgi:hypothetical protein